MGSSLSTWTKQKEVIIVSISGIYILIFLGNTKDHDRPKA